MEQQPVVLVGGAVRTMEPARPTAEAVAVADGRILAVGTRDEVAAAAPGAVEHDLGGRTLLPGFIDAHNHLSIAALHPRWRDLTGVTDPDAVLDAVRRQAAAEPDAGWVRLCNWEGLDVAPVTRGDLDALGLDRPVVLAHATLHAGLVDGRGLAELGIGRSTPDPAGGEIGHAHDGEPDGWLAERAWGEAHRRSLAAYADPDRWAEHVAARARLLLAEGITAVHDAACSPEAEAVYRAMAEAGTLPLSVLAMPHPSSLFSHDFGSRFDGPGTGEGDERFRVGPAKLFADGGIAIGLDVSVGGHPIRGGLLFDDLERVALQAADRGWRLAVHAIGNVGVDRALDAFTAVARRRPGEDHRFRVEHALVTGAGQWRRLAELDAIGVAQPGFVEHVGIQSGGVRFDDHRWLAFAGLAEAGVTLAGSSDDPCAPVPPLWCAHRGADRRTSTGIALDPEQAVPVEDWLRAYTSGAAIAGGQEAERGRLAAGLRADLVVLDGDRVAETWVAGEPVFVAGRD
jgi:predicted amidohydrolase YtcJ